MTPVAAATDGGDLPTGATAEEPKVLANLGLLPAKGWTGRQIATTIADAGSFDLVGKPRELVMLLPWASSFHRQLRYIQRAV